MFKYALILKKGKGLAPELRSKNPIGRITVREDGSGILSESFAICLWLADKEKSKSLIFTEGSFEREKVHMNMLKNRELLQKL